jgi:predicted RNA-binding protein with PUA domain
MQQASIPFVFCFGCRQVIPERPCDACDAETEIFQVTTETDRRLAVSRLSAEADRT